MDYNILKTHIVDIQQASADGNLVIFVGAGVSCNSGVPVWNELTKALKAELPEFAQNVKDDLKLAQIYKTTYPDRYQKKVRSVLKDGEIVPNPIHDAILDLKPCHIITTNYDTLIEQACVNRHELYQTVSSDEDIPALPNTRIIVKMHGDYAKCNIVLAESDYYDYSRNFPLLRSFVMSLLASKTVLFIGFSFNDINLKYILRSIQAVLDKKMKPVYLLVDEDYGHEQANYLEEKGVRPICMGSDAIDYFLPFCPNMPQCPDVLTNGHGVNLFQQLTVIKRYEEERDLLRRLFGKLTKFDNDLCVLGDFVVDFLPKECRGKIRRNAYELKIDKSILIDMVGNISSRGNLRQFLKNYSDLFPTIRHFLYTNSIYDINGKGVVSNAFFRKMNRSVHRDGLDMLYRGNYIDVISRIRELGDWDLTYSKADLELPFLYYKIGMYEKAFELFDSLASAYWKNRRYVLYVICRMNLSRLSYIICYDLNNSILKHRAEEIKDVDIKEVIRETPLAGEVKAMFEEIASYRMLIKKESHTHDISGKIEQQKEDAKNGGWAWNNYALELLYDFSSIVDFGEANFIIFDRYSYSISSFSNIAEGLIDSLLIEGDGRFNSKLKELRPELVLLLVYHLPSRNLSEILDRCGSRTLDVDNETVILLKQITANIYISLTNGNGLVDDFISSDLIYKTIRNISILLCYLPVECMPDVDWYSVIASHINRYEEQAYDIIIARLLTKKKPSADAAERLIYRLLHSSDNRNVQPMTVVELVKVIAAEGKKYSKVEPWEMYEQVTLACLSVLYPILTAEQQRSLTAYIKEHIESLAEAIMIELNTDCKILDSTLTNNLKDEVLTSNNQEYKCQTMCLLERLCRTTGYELYKPLVEEIGEKEPFMAFLLNPMAHLKDMNPHWVLYLDENILKGVIKDEDVAVRIGDFCKKAYDWASKSVKERVWHALTTNVDVPNHDGSQPA